MYDKKMCISDVRMHLVLHAAQNFDLELLPLKKYNNTRIRTKCIHMQKHIYTFKHICKLMNAKMHTINAFELNFPQVILSEL